MNNFKNNDTDIFIYSHIPFKPIVDDHTFKVLTCSKEPSSSFDTDLEIFRDYTLNNISDKNLMFNEYCGFYWLWKNYPIKKYIGLNHYRRYYTNYNNLPKIDDIFKHKRIILNEPQKLTLQGYTFDNVSWYAFWHNVEDIHNLGKIIQEYYPQYMDGYEKMLTSNYLYPCSLFTMDKNTFFEYCEFVFGVLNKYCEVYNLPDVESCIKHVEENKDKYIKPNLQYYTINMQARIIGYLAERVLETFLMHGGDKSLESNCEIFKWKLI